MSNLIVILNVFVIVGLVVSAILAVHFEKLLSSVIALGVVGIFAAAEFLLLHAPDVATGSEHVQPRDQCMISHVIIACTLT